MLFHKQEIHLQFPNLFKHHALLRLLFCPELLLHLQLTMT
jgi:hypothetical protein